MEPRFSRETTCGPPSGGPHDRLVSLVLGDADELAAHRVVDREVPPLDVTVAGEAQRDAEQRLLDVRLRHDLPDLRPGRRAVLARLVEGGAQDLGRGVARSAEELQLAAVL